MTGRGVGVIAYREPSSYPHVQGTGNDAICNVSVKTCDSDGKRCICFPVSSFPFRDVEEAPVTYDPIRGTSSSEVRAACKNWHYSGKENKKLLAELKPS